MFQRLCVKIVLSSRTFDNFAEITGNSELQKSLEQYYSARISGKAGVYILKNVTHKTTVFVFRKLIICIASIVSLAIALERAEILSGAANILILTVVAVAACLIVSSSITQLINQIAQQSALELSKKSISVCEETVLSLQRLSTVLERNAETLYEYAVVVEKHIAENNKKT